MALAGFLFGFVLQVLCRAMVANDNET